MGLEFIGHDPAAPASADETELVQRADVLVFSAPIRRTGALIARYAELAAGSEAGRLWLDVTSIKAAPVAAMLASRAEVVGLHPMTAPPKTPTLKGRVMVVCEARLDTWRPWVASLLAALEAECVQATPEQHDRVMALVQAMVHAAHLAQAGVLRSEATRAGPLDALMPFRSASFEMDAAIIARILSLNPAIYEDIQFGNPHTILIWLNMLCHNIHRNLTQVHIRADSGCCCDSSRFQNILYHRHGKFPCSHLISIQIICCIYKYFIN